VVISETYCDVDTIIGQDESGVRSSELGVRHVEMCMFLKSRNVEVGGLVVAFEMVQFWLCVSGNRAQTRLFRRAYALPEGAI